MTGLESFANPTTIGPMYPFVGSEGFLTIVLVAAWLIWQIWQIGSESREMAEQSRKARENRK
ncbi:MAG: hypothetical protein FJX36_06760 [Alphaproteobacteria bacterium]|nr:hypothetical protein [Alphaproteobacteria bacterium]